MKFKSNFVVFTMSILPLRKLTLLNMRVIMMHNISGRCRYSLERYEKLPWQFPAPINVAGIQNEAKTK